VHLPAYFEERSEEVIFRLITANPLGTVFWNSPMGPEADHIPLLLDRTDPMRVVLLGHVAKENPFWLHAGSCDRVLAVFRGVDGYISPSWYPGKAVSHRYVPTWNYEVVHAYGALRLFDDKKRLRGLLARLTRDNEASASSRWRMSDAPADFIEAQLDLIGVIEISVDRLRCKRKLSQNRNPEDFDGVVRGLHAIGRGDLAEAVSNANQAPPVD
jgi:transcriptional regulator